MSEYKSVYYASQNNLGCNACRTGKAAGGSLCLGMGVAIKLLPLAVRLVDDGLVAVPALVLSLRVTLLVSALGPGLTDVRCSSAGYWFTAASSGCTGSKE